MNALEVSREFAQYGTPKEHGANFKFPNGWGASLICWEFSYGGRDGLWEIAVLDKDGRLSYDTEVTSDVEGYLTPEAARELLQKIATLDAAGKLPEGVSP